VIGREGKKEKKRKEVGDMRCLNLNAGQRYGTNRERLLLSWEKGLFGFVL
jgi:hypothetical protein